MPSVRKKAATPPYAPYSTFYNFINDLKTTGIPSHIDRSVMGTMSGSGQSAMLATLKALHLVNSDSEPGEKLIKLVNGTENEFSTIMAEVIKATYDFLFDGSIEIRNTTSKKIEEKFRDAGASGSTLTKCISFFLAAAKAAEISVSPHVKAPKLHRNPVTRTKRNNVSNVDGHDNSTPPANDGKIPERMRKFEIPLRDIKDGILYLPEEIENEDAKKALAFIKFTLEQYYDLSE